MRKRPIIRERLRNALHRLPSKDEITWFRNRLLSWYTQNQRHFPWRQSSDPYLICIAEMLLQQTSANKVAQILGSFTSNYPSWSILANAKKEDIKQVILPLGLHERRANILQKLAEVMAVRESLPSTRKELEELPGIGQYIANVIMVALYEKRLPFLDVNMSRVLERFFGPREMADIRSDPYLQALSRKVVNIREALHANWMILDFAAIVCTSKSPKCKVCTLAERCRSIS